MAIGSPQPPSRRAQPGARPSAPRRHARKHADAAPPRLAGKSHQTAGPGVAIATPTSRAFALTGCFTMVALIALPVVAGRALVQDLVFIFYMLTLAQFWNLLAGYAGLVSVGQQTFVGLGGYLLFALTIMG